MQGQVLSLYLDNSKVGCGWRRYLVVKAGRIHARIVCIENAEPLTVPMTELAHGKAVEFKPRRLAKRLRHTALTYHREDSWSIKQAVRLLAQMPARVAS